MALLLRHCEELWRRGNRRCGARAEDKFTCPMPSREEEKPPCGGLISKQMLGMTKFSNSE